MKSSRIPMRVRVVFMRGFLLALLLAAWHAGAGELSPSGAPAPTMKNLQEIHEQAAQANGAVGGGNALLFYPYILERAGKTSDTQYTFDTDFDLTLTTPFMSSPGEVAPVTVYLYLFTNNGQVATSATAAPIANPAVFTLDQSTPHVSFAIENLIVDAGGFPSPIFLGYAILAINSGNWNDVAVVANVVNAHTSAFDLSFTELRPTRVSDPVAPRPEKTDAPNPDAKK